MRITGVTAPLQNMLLSALPKVAQFAVPEAPAAQAPPMASATQPVSVEMMVALAASEPAIDRRRRVAAAADRGLAALERLDAELLAGIPAVDSLREIAAWSASLDEADDVELRELLKDIELRVRVELAKHDVVV